MRDAFKDLRDRYTTGGPPPPVADFVKAWAKQNVRALERIAARVLSEPPGTAFTVALFSFVAFPTETDRQSYQAALYRELKARDGSVTPESFHDEHALRLHLWCRGQLETALAELAQRAAPTYQASEAVAAKEEA